MTFREIASFDVLHGDRPWPWLSFVGNDVAFSSSAKTISTRRVDGDRVEAGASFTLPSDLTLAAFALSPEGVLAVAGTVDGVSTVAILDATGERQRIACAFTALAFARTGKRLWIASETDTETVITLVDTTTLATVGEARSVAIPRPSLFEIHVHPTDDAILLLAACGEDGTYARVVGYAGDDVNAVPGTLDNGALAAGFVGFSPDALRVHLVEADELRTHGWPTLDELSSVPLVDDFISSFAGAVLGEEILVDGEDGESEEDLVMLFDRSALRGVILPLPAPAGMWAGRLGANAIVTVRPKGDPVRATVLAYTKDPKIGARLGS